MVQIKIILILLLISSQLLAHGEDKEGPNGGFVRMPGMFHTELILDGKNKVKIYLLDLQWKNPSVAKSNVKLSYKKINAKCEIKESFFSCEFPQTVHLTQKGELKLTAVREEQKGIEVSYPLPLKLATPKFEHSAHQ